MPKNFASATRAATSEPRWTAPPTAATLREKVVVALPSGSRTVKFISSSAWWPWKCGATVRDSTKSAAYAAVTAMPAKWAAVDWAKTRTRPGSTQNAASVTSSKTPETMTFPCASDEPDDAEWSETDAWCFSTVVAAEKSIVTRTQAHASATRSSPPSTATAPPPAAAALPSNDDAAMESAVPRTASAPPSPSAALPVNRDDATRSETASTYAAPPATAAPFRSNVDRATDTRASVPSIDNAPPRSAWLPRKTQPETEKSTLASRTPPSLSAALSSNVESSRRTRTPFLPPTAPDGPPSARLPTT